MHHGLGCAYGIFKAGRRFVGKTVGIAGEHLTGAEMAAAIGGMTQCVGVDVGSEDSVRGAFDTIRQVHPVIDILVNNAGKFVPKPFSDTTEADFDALMNLHAKGPYFAMQEAAKVLSERGRIVNISSAGTQLHYYGATAYLGSRGALEQFTQGVAQELAPRGITVNTVAPGFTDTGILTDAYKKMGIEASPFKRLGTPQDIAEVVAFLVSEQARWVTGQTIQAGGGIVM